MRLPRPHSVLLAVAVAFAASTQPACRADLINGDFSSGLVGWDVSDPAYVTVQGGQAVLTESLSDLEVTLSQTFVIPIGATSLSFTLVDLVLEDDGFPPNAFGASLVDPSTSLSLVPTVDLFTDSFYIRDLVPGVTEGQAAAGVAVEPSPTALPLRITVELPSMLSGQNARIIFRLLSGGFGTDASVTIDDVEVRAGQSPTIPEPSSVRMVVLALVLSPCLVIPLRRRSLGLV